jgi:hypothetical protein
MGECEGCKYEGWDGYDWPCADCSRINSLREDMFEPADEDEDESEDEDEDE